MQYVVRGYERFSQTWNHLVSSLREGGRFAGHFLGIKDSWAKEPGMTFLTRKNLMKHFSDFELELFEEKEDDKPTALGEDKHWHVFSVVAKRTRSAP
jgi:tellurite methyltransferase